MRVNNFADRKKGLEGEQEDIVMGIDADNHLTLLNSLTNLYSNPVMAAFREYCANASDAHKDSGQKAPFDVTFPHRYEGTTNLRIRDYGKGMTEEQITKVYSQYGATTKAKSNTQVGGFGLGSKSGLAVSNHLYVNTIANGILLKVKILKNQKNEAVIRILSKEPTNAASGTEIILPVTVTQLNELREKAEEELVGYDPSQVRFQGEKIAYSVHDKSQFIPVTLGSNIVAYIARNSMDERNNYSKSPYSSEWLKSNYSIIMGGVFYPTLPTMGSVSKDDMEFYRLTEKLNGLLSNTPRIILNVPVGSVDLPPHRDSIIDTVKTWESLKGLLSNLYMGLPATTESYLNAMPLKEAATTVASMRALFSPEGKWKHKGKIYENDMGVCMTNTPMLYANMSYYGSGTTRLEGKIGAAEFTLLYTRTDSSDYNYMNQKTKKPLTVVNLAVGTEKYEEIVKYLENEQLHYTVKEKLTKPRIGTFITRYVKPVLEETTGKEKFYVLVTPVGQSIPAHLAGAIDCTMTEDSVRVQYRKLFPPEPKKTVQQTHCRVTEDKWEYSIVSSHEQVVYFGGKDSYGTEDFMHGEKKGFAPPEAVLMKKVSRGSVASIDDYRWVQDGLLKILDTNTALIAVGDTRSTALFQKAFKDAKPLGEIVMDYYENLDADRKLAVQHAYSLIAMWGEGTNELFTILGGKDYPMQNESIRLMFSEPELVSVAYYLYSFKDNYVKELSNWKKDYFMPALKNKELAWKLLLPLQSLIGQISYREHAAGHKGEFKTRIPLRGDNILHIDVLAEFANKLTANVK